MSRALRGLLIGSLLIPGMLRSAPDSVDEKRESLKKIQVEIEQKRREKDQASRRAREIREEVARISHELESARGALLSVESRLTEAEKVRGQAESRLSASRQSLDQWEDRLTAVLRAFYERSTVAPEGGGVPLVYEEALLSERVTGLSFALDNHRSVEALRDDLAQAEQDWRRLKQEREREERRVVSARENMRALQRTNEGRQALLSRQIETLNASARRFEKMIEGLIAKQRAEQAHAAQRPRTTAERSAERAVAERWRGKLPWPVEGAVVEKFGRTQNPDLDSPLISNGIRIRPAAGAQAKAIDGGEVLFAGPFMNYGLMALVSHPDHLHSIYAHLGSLRVTQGQRLVSGEGVGEAGRDDQGRPLVYFELRVNGNPVDPERWLR